MTYLFEDSQTGQENHKSSPDIAIVGMEGSGKTVLTVVLAKRYKDFRHGVMLQPIGVKTLKYVEKMWNILRSGEWPPSTPPGELFDLKWEFNFQAGVKCEVRLIDSAGQDLRYLFEEEQIYVNKPQAGQREVLAQYLRSADIALFLINMKDFVGQKNPDRRIGNEAAIKSAIDYFVTRNQVQNLCIVLTEADRYRDLAKERGGWAKLLSAELPNVFGPHILANRITMLPVSAVWETEQQIDTEGRVRIVPQSGFRSGGFQPLIAWLKGRVLAFSQQAEQERVERQQAQNLQTKSSTSTSCESPETTRKWTGDTWVARVETGASPSSPGLPPVNEISRPGAYEGVAVESSADVWIGVAILCFGGFLFFLVASFCYRWLADDWAPNFSVSHKSTWVQQSYPFYTDHGMRIDVSVSNSGGKGTARVWIIVNENGKRVYDHYHDVYFTGRGKMDVWFVVWEIYDWKNKITYDCTVETLEK